MRGAGSQAWWIYVKTMQQSSRPLGGTPEQDYMFERPIPFAHGDGSTSSGRIDCYRRGHFVLKAKRRRAATDCKRFDDGLLQARSQVEG